MGNRPHDCTFYGLAPFLRRISAGTPPARNSAGRKVINIAGRKKVLYVTVPGKSNEAAFGDSHVDFALLGISKWRETHQIAGSVHSLCHKAPVSSNRP
jgi:hypothetical protein